MDKKLIVVYATRYGQTEKIARRIAEVAHGEAIALGEAAEEALETATDVVVAGAVYFGRHQSALVRFVRKNISTLLKRHTAFVSVCGATEAQDKHHGEGQVYARRFLDNTGWAPDLVVVFAGATPYTRYGWLVRFMMRNIARGRGLGTDTSRDYEYTDWTAVDAFAQTFAQTLWRAA